MIYYPGGGYPGAYFPGPDEEQAPPNVIEQPAGGANWVITSTVAFDRRRMFFRQAVGGAEASVDVESQGDGQRVAQGRAEAAAVALLANGMGRKRSAGSAMAAAIIAQDGRGVPDDLEGLLLQFVHSQIVMTLV